jgi:radical SAM protein with 4Fe4S-binding SPASM domain
MKKLGQYQSKDQWRFHMPQKYKPNCAVWEITLKCNLNCSHCGSTAGEKRKRELSTDEAMALCDQLAEIGTNMVSLMGGEPLVRKDWQAIGLRCLDNGLETAIVSNGILVKKEINNIMKISPKVVGLSLDGLEDTHDKIRGKPGTFNNVMEAARILRENNLETTFITTVSKLNYHELPSLRELIMDKGIAWQVQVAMPIGRFEKELLISEEEFYALCNFISNVRKKYGFKKLPIAGGHCIGYDSYFNPKVSTWSGCQAGTSVLGIASDGGIRGCLSIPEEITIGNIKDTKLWDIWNNDENFPHTRQFKIDMLGNNCTGCSSAKSCKGGCSSMSYSLSGKFNNNPYCQARLEREIISQSLIGKRLLNVADWVRKKQIELEMKKRS